MKSKSKLIFLISFLFILGNVFLGAQRGNDFENIRGSNKVIIQVRDSKTGYGIAAELHLKEKDQISEAIIKTDNNGKIILELRDGIFAYKVIASGYKAVENYFQLQWTKELKLQVWLDPIDIPNELKLENIKSLIKPDYAYIYGFVVDNEQYQPLKNVKVKLERLKAEAETDDKGFFSMYAFANINFISELPEKDNLIFQKEGFKTYIIKNTFIIPNEAIGFLVDLEKGIGVKSREDLHKIISSDQETQLEVPTIKNPYLEEKAISYPTELPVGDSYLKPLPPSYLLVWDPPNSIRVGTNCSCTTCSTVDVVSLETYVERGLNDEWIASWVAHSLRSGAIPYRSYGTYYVYNPINANYDICSSTCCQVYDTDTAASTVAAADYTAGILLQRNNSIFRSEYSAENNNYNCSDAGCVNSDCSCGNGYAGSPAASWPCLSDSVDAGYTCYGHGRGMCQWGTQRWANNQGQLWKWIVNHYYNNDGNPGGLRSSYMTSPMDITNATPNPNTVPPGGTFTINVSAVNYAEKTHSQIMIGASLYSTGTGYIDDPANDTKVTLNPGNNNVSRPFTVPSTTPDGVYDLIVALWFDVDENNQITGTDLPLVSKTYTGAVTVSSCLPPGAFNLLAPSDGSSWVSIQPTLDWEDSANATSYLVEVALDSNFTNVIRSANVSVSQWQVSPALDYCRTHYWRVTASNACGSITSSVWSFDTDWQLASYSSTYKAPLCPKTRCCGPGSLIDSRDTITGKTEQNQPNTINNSCADGTAGTYHTDESLDSLLVRTTDDTEIGPGKQVIVYAYAWCWGTTDYLDLYYTTNISSPSWTLLGTYQCDVSGQAKMFSHTFTLSTQEGYHAIRGNYRYDGSASECSTGTYDDHDDLILTVCTSAPGQASNPSPGNGSTICTTTPTLSWAAASGASSYDVYVDGSLKCANVTTTSCSPGVLSLGSHNWYVVSKNACGNTTGPTWSFTIQSAPGQASNPSPPNGGTTCSSPTLSWSAAAGATNYDVYADANLICSNITTTSCPTTYTSGSHSWYVVSKNICGNTTGPTWNFSIDTTPCPAIANNLLVSKSGTNVNVSWTAVSCPDLANYEGYGSTSYSAPFPSGWSILATTTSTSFTDSLTSSYIAYKTITVDACGNKSN